MKWRISQRVAVLLLAVAAVAIADLPSCYRARCSHCSIQFIAQMCPNTCAQCPAQSAISGAGGATQVGAQSPHPMTNAHPFQNGVAVPRAAHGQPTVVYNTAAQLNGQTGEQPAIPQPPQQPTYQAPTPQQQQIPPQAYAPQQQQQVYVPQQQFPAAAPQPYQQQFAGQPAPTQFQFGAQQPQQQFQQFPQQPFPQQPFPQQPQPFGAQQPQQPFGQQPFGIPQQSNQFPNAFNPMSGFNGFGQQPAAAASSQPFNPFQPFLQQSFQQAAQQPAPAPNAYNPFGFATLPPAPTFAPVTPPTFQPFTPPSMSFPTLPPLATAPPATQAPPPPPQQPPVYQQPQQPQQPDYTQPQQPTAQPQPATETQKPRQIYNTQQQIQQIPQRVEPQPPPQQPYAPQPQQQQYAGQQPYPQPARANAVPTAPIQQSRNIDSTPLNIDKHDPLVGVAKPAALQQTCPKQPNWEPCIGKDLANERFRNCCQRLGEGCAQLCNYDQSLTTLQLAVLTGRCPLGKVADMMICASGYEDATPCCQAYGVFEPGFEHCRPYCNPAAGLPNDGMLSEKYRCLGKLSQIQRCFYVSQRP